MSTHRIALSVADGIARLTLDNPAGRNAVDGPFVEQFAEAARRCAEDASIKIIVIAATGDYFSVGGDLGDFLAHESAIEMHVLRLAKVFHLGVARLQAAPALIVLALKGMAAGGGFSLVCGADLVVAARSAKLTSAYTRAGLTPDGGGTLLLERIVGRRKAFELMALNTILTADEARSLGLVNKVVEDSALNAAVDALVGDLLRIPSGALIRLKSLMRDGDDAVLDRRLQSEALTIAKQAAHPQTLSYLRRFLGRETRS
jgi:2-(1,2-epoxy-1,2-dihydrophenyl)acetyl-CoA isomerase